MEVSAVIYYGVLPLFFLLLRHKLLSQKGRYKNLPPSPPYLPIIGNLHLIKQPLHQTLLKFSQKYGPVFSLRFGSRFVVVVSSPSAVEECFTKNDIILANRAKSWRGKILTYNFTTVIAASYGSHWRNLRRICSLEIFSNHRMNLSSGVRRDEITRFLQKLSRNSGEEFSTVELKSKFSELTFNVIVRMISGKRYYGEDSDVTDVEEAKQFRKMIQEMTSFGVASSVADFVPIARLFGLGRVNKLKSLANGLDALFQGLVDKHRNEKDKMENGDTMIDHLLSLQESQPEYYTDQIIKGLILILILAGTDTTSVTLEWAMSELLNHPEVLKKARAELDQHVGDERLVDEADISKLPYLQNIISETLRLHPAAPVLVPHRASEDCTVAGYDVPRDTMLLVNAWAIHRDPKLWTEAERFNPERFDSVEGQGHLLIPFGMGRRACPGAGLAQRTIGLTLAALIQCFDWKRLGEDEVDMAEGNGITVPKAVALEGMCKQRPILQKIMS